MRLLNKLQHGLFVTCTRSVYNYPRPMLRLSRLPFSSPFYLANFLQRAILFPGGHYDCYNSAHQTPPPITFTFILSNYRSRLLFQEESELSSKRWASAPRRPDSPCVLGAPTSREVSQSHFYPEFSFDPPEIN